MPALKQPKKPYGPHAQTEERTEAIAATIRDGSFKHGVTLRAFREKWDLSEHRVAELSTLAQKKIAAELAADHDRIRAKGFAMLERIADEAEHSADAKGNTAGHLAVAIRAVDTWLTKSGAAAPAASTVKVESDLSGLSDEQLEAIRVILAAGKAGEK